MKYCLVEEVEEVEEGKEKLPNTPVREKQKGKMLQTQVFQPKTVIIQKKQNQSFGFTIRHFIAYPPEEEYRNSSNGQRNRQPQHHQHPQYIAMETIFIKEVHPNSPAHLAGLQTGDRVLMVNNIPVAGISYSTVVAMIKTTVNVLRLQVVPKECDVLQMYYTDIAHNPESNRRLDISRPLKSNAPTIQFNPNLLLSSSERFGGGHSPIQSIRNNGKRIMPTIYGSSIDESSSKLVPNNEGGLLVRSHQMALPVLSGNTTKNDGTNIGDSSDFAIRLRKSIEQKEEFLKPSFHATPQSSLLPYTGSKYNFQLTRSSGGGGATTTTGAMGNSGVRIQNISSNYDREYFKNFALQEKFMGGSNSRDYAFHEECRYLESLPETGVTNKVFERKQAVEQFQSLDHFKPLTINTNLDERPIFKAMDSEIPLDYGNRILSHSRNQGKEIENIKPQQIPVFPIREMITDGQTTTKDYSNVLINSNIMQKSNEVVRRYKAIVLDDNKPMRRTSYLMATNNEVEIPNEFSSLNITTTTVEEKQTQVDDDLSDNVRISITSSSSTNVNGKIDPEEAEIYEDELEVKSPYIYGKKSIDFRSWKQVKVQMKGDILRIDAGKSSKLDGNVIDINLKNYNVLKEIKEDKKKFVFKLQQKSPLVTMKLDSVESSGSNSSSSNEKTCGEYKEVLFKTKNLTELKKWISLLQDKASDNELQNSSHGRQMAEPQKTAATSSVSTSTTYCCDETIQDYSLVGSSSTKCDGESDSAFFQSPIMKPRKTPTIAVQKSASVSTAVGILHDKDLGSPKTKNWKDLLLRRKHGTSSSSSGADISNSSSARLIGSIGVPLKSCPMSKDNEFVPLIVDVCTKIVESKGLNIVGIYRIPGNKAAISELKEQVNKIDFNWGKIETDPRWEDVNVVSSLLKLFIRSLPDALLPSTFYINFIEADKKFGEERLKSLRYLLKDLPPYSYETMKHLIRHLHRISKNCDVNLMQPKNLAIIFGPSIIRTPNITLEIAVKDMKHQCGIVELLVSQYEFFFENGPLPNMENNANLTSANISSAPEEDRTSLLLDNVSKIERLQDKESITSRLLPHLRRRTHSKRSAVSSDTYSGESVLSLEIKKSSPESILKESIVVTKNLVCDHRSSEEASVILTDDESGASRISDSGSMSLTTITDTLESKLKSLRSASESDESNNSNLIIDGSNNLNIQRRNSTRKNFSQPLILQESTNIPYADESPERHSQTHTTADGSMQLKNNITKNSSITSREEKEETNNSVVSEIKIINTTTLSSPPRPNNITLKSTVNNTKNSIITATAANTISSQSSQVSSSSTTTSSAHQESSSTTTGTSVSQQHQHRFSSVYESSCSDDSEVSTTSDPRESLLISPAFIERYKKRRDYKKLFRSASFNCRNYSTRQYSNNMNGGNNVNYITNSSINNNNNNNNNTNNNNNNNNNSSNGNSGNLTKDEKTDMNITKKRQIQNKQNRSIKRRHTVGGPHDYSATITRRTTTNSDHQVLEVGIRIKNVNRRN